MIYAYDKAAEIPVMDLYNTQMMLAEINAAKDMYEKAEENFKDFKEKYGDLTFSNDAYQDWYNKNFDIRGKINEIYERGGDPLRNRADRTELIQWINRKPYGELNKIRQWDTNLKQYLLSAAKLGDKYNPDYDKWRLGDDPTNWGNGVVKPFNETFALPLESLKSLTESSYNNIQPRSLTKQEVIDMGHPYNPNAKYTGTPFSDLLNIAHEATPGLFGTSQYEYYKELARRKLVLSGNLNPTEDQINSLLEFDIANQHKEYLRGPVEDLSDFWKQQSLNIQRQGLQIRRDIAALKAGLNKNNELGSWTDRRKYDISLQFASVTKGISELQLANLTPHQYYKLLLVSVEGNDNITALALFSNYSSPELIEESGNIKRRPISYGENGLHITALREEECADYTRSNSTIGGNNSIGSYAGMRIMMPNENINYAILKKFDDWLSSNHISGYMPNNNLSVNYNIPYGQDMYDVNGTVRVKKDIIQRYGGNIASILRGIGAVGVDVNGKVIWNPQNDEDKYKTKYIPANVEYIDIPSTRTLSGAGTGNNQIDSFHTSLLSKRKAVDQEAQESVDYDDFILSD